MVISSDREEATIIGQIKDGKDRGDVKGGPFVEASMKQPADNEARQRQT